MRNDKYVSPTEIYIAGALIALGIACGTNTYCNYLAEETKKIREEIATLHVLERAEAKKLDSLVQTSTNTVSPSRKELTDLTKF